MPMKEAIIKILATAGVAFVLAGMVGWGLSTTNIDAAAGLSIIGIILAGGVLAAMTWPAMDNSYTRWIRKLSASRADKEG